MANNEFKKRPGRKPKYNSDEERRNAKREQTKISLRKFYAGTKDIRKNITIEKRQLKLLNFIYDKTSQLAENYRQQLMNKLMQT